MDAIRENEADYLLTVKKGNPLTCQETEELFAELKKEQEQLTEHPEKAAACEKQLASYEVFKTSEKNRSRMEYRTMQICHDTELITLCRKQPEIKTVGIISSRNISAQEALEIKRNHWKIENSLHHVLDDLFREDRSSAKKSKNNLAVIRKIVYNLIRIAIFKEKKESGPTEMRDQFSDDLTLIEKYVFRGISRLYTYVSTN